MSTPTEQAAGVGELEADSVSSIACPSFAASTRI
jgi:hypothetical protein